MKPAPGYLSIKPSGPDSICLRVREGRVILRHHDLYRIADALVDTADTLTEIGTLE